VCHSQALFGVASSSMGDHLGFYRLILSLYTHVLLKTNRNHYKMLMATVVGASKNNIKKKSWM